MGKVKKNKSGIFLMELMAVVLIILLTITTCVNIFFKSQKLSEKSFVLTNACIQAENVAQLLKHDRGNVDSLVKYYKIPENKNEIVVYFDKEFNVCEKSLGNYKMTVKQSLKDSIIFSDIDVSDIDGDRNIYNLDVSIAKQEGGANG